MQAVIYTRWSPRPGADDCNSTQTQLSRLRPYCQAHNWAIIGEFDDSDRTGATTDGRPGLADALEAVCAAKGVLIVYSLSRLARSTRDAIAIAERLERSGANLVSLHESIDTSSPMGRFVFRMFASLAELEREQIAQRTSDAMQSLQRGGRLMGSRPPFGYKAVRAEGTTMRGSPRRKLVPDPKQQAVLARIHELAAQGHRSQRIQTVLKAEGTTIARSLIHRLITNRESHHGRQSESPSCSLSTSPA